MVKMLEMLFTSKTRTKLLTYFLFSAEKCRLRELARNLKLPVSAVSRELSNLQKLSLVRKDKDYFAANSDSNIFQDIRNIFLKTDAFALELKGALKNKPLEFAFVFGSFANESYNLDS